MNGFKSFFMIFMFLFSTTTMATELGQQLLMDQDSYEEVVGDKTNYSDVKTAAKDFCAKEFTDNSTYADAPPPGVIFACNDDAMAEMFVSWFDYPRLEKMFALNGGEKDAAGLRAEALGYSKPNLKTINISKDNIVIWNVINTILEFFVGIIFLFIVISFFNESRKLTSENSGQSSLDAMSISIRKQWAKIIALGMGMLMLSTFPIYLVILLSGMVNFGAFLFFDPADEQGVIDKTMLKPLQESESIDFGNFMLRTSLEGGQTAQYFLNTVDYQSEIDKNWDAFNYDDPTKQQVFQFVEGLKGAFNAHAEFDSVWFSNLKQVEQLCFRFDETYKNGGMNILFDFVDNDDDKNCISTVDKTDFETLIPGSELAGIGVPGVDWALQSSEAYAVSLVLANKIAEAINKGNSAGLDLVNSYNEVFNMAKVSLETKTDVYQSTSYEALVNEYAGIISSAIENVDNEDLSTDEQQVLKALIANSAKEAMMGLQVPDIPPVPSEYLTGESASTSSTEELYGEHSNYLINQYKSVYSDKWYEYVVAQECSKSENKEVAFKARNEYVTQFNSYSSSEVYKDLSNKNKIMNLNNNETKCIVYNADGTKRVLGSNSIEEDEELELNRAAAELATRMISSIAFDASVEAYNLKIAGDSFAKEELEPFKKGFFGMFLNLQKRAKNQNKLGRLNKAFNHYTFTPNYTEIYDTDLANDFVLSDVVGNYNPSAKLVNEMIIKDIDRASLDSSIIADDGSDEKGNFIKVLDFLFEDYFYDCVNPVQSYGNSYSCGDPTYMQVLLTAPKAIPQSVEIISYYMVISAIDTASDSKAGAAIKSAGFVGKAIQLLLLALSILQFLMLPFYYIALYVMLMSVIGLILTAFIPISIIIDVMYSVLYFIFGIILLIVYVVPFSSLLGKDDEVKEVFKKIIMKLFEPIFTVSIIIFYYFEVSGHLNGMIGALIFDVLLSPYDGSQIIIYSIMYGLNVVIQLTLITVVFTIKDLTIISSIRGMVSDIIGVSKSASLDYKEAMATISAPRELGKNAERHLNAAMFKKHSKGIGNKARSAAKGFGNRLKKMNEE